MKLNKIAAAVMAITVAAAGLVYGQGRENDRGRNDQNRPGNEARQQDRGPDRARGDNARREDWRRGARIPSEYRNRQYVVNDWRGRHLSAPPRGYHWVQVNGDYVLAAVATGIILDTLLSQ